MARTNGVWPLGGVAQRCCDPKCTVGEKLDHHWEGADPGGPADESLWVTILDALDRRRDATTRLRSTCRSIVARLEGCESRPCPLTKHFAERIAASGITQTASPTTQPTPAASAWGCGSSSSKCGSNGAAFGPSRPHPGRGRFDRLRPLARLGEGKRSRLVVSACSRSNRRGYVVFSLRAVLESNARRAISTTMTRAGWLRRLQVSDDDTRISIASRDLRSSNQRIPRRGKRRRAESAERWRDARGLARASSGFRGRLWEIS